MATTAEIPSTMEDVNSNNRTRLALASRHAILNSHDRLVLCGVKDAFN